MIGGGGQERTGEKGGEGVRGNLLYGSGVMSSP